MVLDEVPRARCEPIAGHAFLHAFATGDAGGLADPVASLLTCAPAQVWASVINGRVVVEDGQFLPFELPPVIETHNKISREMMTRAGVL